MEEHRFQNIFYTYSPKGKRETERPMKRWTGQFREDPVGVGTHKPAAAEELFLVQDIP
jgi:hypothetical protein